MRIGTRSASVRRGRRSAVAIAALVVASAAYALTLPPPARRLTVAVPPRIVFGAYHIHTRRSDGSGSVDDVAHAASIAGLAFVILTDHGNAMRAPDPPTYLHGVLVIDAVEVSTTGGHIVALGLTRPAPYPLAGAPRDVIEDIHRLGGKAVVAHPDSPAAGLRYSGPDWGYDGVEWLNMDSEWRGRSGWALAEAALDYVARPPESLARLLVRPATTLGRWDRSSRMAPTFGLAALDAHARIGWRARQEPRVGRGVHEPSYVSMFRTLAQGVVLDAPFSGDAASDARRLLEAITTGRSFSIVRAFAEPAWLDFTAHQGSVIRQMGERLIGIGTVSFHAAVPGSAGASTVLYRNGQPVATGGSALDFTADAPGVYRIEVALAGRPVPWMVSNPITVDVNGPVNPFLEADAESGKPLSTIAPIAWEVERDATSMGTVQGEAAAERFDFRLGGVLPRAPYAAISTPVRLAPGIKRLGITLRASRPMRVSLQLRDADGRRWRREVYVEPSVRSCVVPLAEFTPADRDAAVPLESAQIATLLVVIDTLGSLPGATGTLWVSTVGAGAD